MENKESKWSDIFGGVFGCLLQLYFIVSEIMAVYFFVDYCKNDDSLVKIILLDPILSEIKGFLWMFFI